MNRGTMYANAQAVRADVGLSDFDSGGDFWGIPTALTFVSHQSRDREAAVDVARVLSRGSRRCYVDVFDPDVDGNDPLLERYLRGIIRRCDSLIAVVSQATRESWWVPLEIGVALDREKHIATYLAGRVDLPNYLWLWPVLRSDSDVAQWGNDMGLKEATQINAGWRSLSRSQKESGYPVRS